MIYPGEDIPTNDQGEYTPEAIYELMQDGIESLSDLVTALNECHDAITDPDLQIIRATLRSSSRSAEAAAYGLNNVARLLRKRSINE